LVPLLPNAGPLPALDRLNLPIPLGGTSNHFRVSALKWLMAWDPFNVTEDADLGMRLARHGLSTCTFYRSSAVGYIPLAQKKWLPVATPSQQLGCCCYQGNGLRPLEPVGKIRMHTCY
jgi:hypothetical protein